MSSLDYLDLCRLCLVKDRVSVPIFEGEGDVRQIFLKIAACLPVKVGREDKLPKKICDDCVYKVELFYQFWNTTANAEKQLLQWLGEVSMDDKQGYVTGAHDPSMMKPGQNTGENRLDGSSVMQQVNEHTNNMGMGMMDGMGIGMPMMIPNSGQQPQQQQMTSVPMDTGGNAVQNVQPVPGPSAQIGQQKINAPTNEDEDEDESEEEDNSDDECDGDDGLPVKEESEDEPNRTIEPTTFVNVSLACDEAGPSGLQQQKIGEMPEMVMPPTDGDPKSGIHHHDTTDTSSRRRSLRLQRKGGHNEVVIERGEKSDELCVKVKKERNEVEKQICKDDDESLMSYCEVKIECDDENETSFLNESDDLIYFDDENYENKENYGDEIHGDYSCRKCNISLKTLKMLKSHTRSIHEAIQCFKCKICHKIYNELAAFESHIVSKHDTDIVLSDNYLDRLTLYRVSRNKSVNEKKPRGRPKKVRTVVTNIETSLAVVLSCSECDYTTKNKDSLAIHVAKHLDYFCGTCDRRFELRRDLIYHIRSIHPEESLICTYCGKTCRTRRALATHRKFVHFKGKFECKICHRGLASQKNLDEHMANCRVKTKSKIQDSVICEECGKQFNNKYKLAVHKRIHDGIRPYACVVCKETYTKKNALKQHLLLHTGAKPYVCDICGKKYSQKPGLTYHRKSHPGPLPPLPPVMIDPFIENLLRRYDRPDLRPDSQA
ncbi:zinc finger protein 614-like isoform X6 [Venturia canescens]|uniref:zinc finger protein 614-like isoform X6 n=1 Tax=Venturia canescens TaxID=32260 RepID=UPI001C9CEA7B|nr:zinc finger protein 614-like isoform X6 [Venturia canescens]